MADVMREVLKRIIDLPIAQTIDVADVAIAMEEMLTGKATDAQISAFLINLKLRGETPSVVAACVESLRRHAVSIPISNVVDIVGTGGDGLDTFNVSTCAGVVAAACGLRVAKHGNRASSSKCGSADVLEAGGAKLEIKAADVVKIIKECGFCFVFSQKFQPAMRHVARTRREIGTRTVFNILGPLSNPANPVAVLAGVYSASLGELVAKTFVHQGMKRAMVVCGEDGLDEISPSGPTNVWIVQDGQITAKTIHPSEFGLPIWPLEAVKGGDVAYNWDIFQKVLRNEPSAYLDWVVFNAGALLFVAAAVPTITEGIKKAKQAIASGAAQKTLDTYLQMSRDSSALMNLDII